MSGTWNKASLTIPNAGDTSEELITENYGQAAISFLVSAPATLPETVRIEVRINTAWATLQSGGEDIIIPAAKATQILQIMCKGVRLKAGAAVGANRVFDLSLAMF